MRELFAIQLEQANLRFNNFELENYLDLSSSFSNLLISKYTQDFLYQLPKVIGSMGSLGDPSVLISSMGKGVRDFFYEPALGIVRSPQAGIKGVAVGTLSLVKNSMYGVFNATSKITSNLAEKAALITMDEEFIKDTTADHSVGVQSNLLHGAKSLGMGFVHGITGLITSPIRGATEEGLIGFIKGIGKGLIGIAAKPTAGVLQFVSSSSAGIRNIGIHKF